MTPHRVRAKPPSTIDPLITILPFDPSGARAEFQILRAPPKRQASAIRNQRVVAAAITAPRLLGIAIDHHAMKHRMVHAADFVLEEKNVTIALRVDDFLETKLMIAHLFRNQAAFFEEGVGTPAATETGEQGAVKRVKIGRNQTLLFRESDEPLAIYDEFRRRWRGPIRRRERRASRLPWWTRKAGADWVWFIGLPMGFPSQ